MHYLNFIEATNLGWKSARVEILQSQACRAAARSFAANIERVLGLLSLPGYTAWVMTEWLAASTRASSEIVGKNATSEQIQARTNDIGSRAEGYLAQAMYAPDVDQRLVMIRMTQMVEQNVVHSRPDIHAAAEGLLKTVLIQTWTAFEVLSEELWEGVLNEHPHRLAGLEGKSGESNEQRQNNPLQKHVVLHELHKHGYDLSKVMGTILKGQFNFTVLASIRRAYFAAFTKSRGDIEEAILHQSLDALSAVRNLLVHRAGIIDQKFLADSNGIASLEPLRKFGLRNPAEFTGDVVRDVVKPVLETSTRLVVSVDAWLTKHPSPQ